MKRERDIEFRCDECSKNVTNKPHIRIFMGFTSGWMMPPFFGGKPIAGIADRNPESHFCKPECFTLYFNRKLHEINPNATRNARRAHVTSARERLLETVSTAGSRVSGQDHNGARDDSRRETSERAVGTGTDLRVGTLRRPVPGLRRDEQGDQQMVSTKSDRRLESGGVEVPEDIMATRPSILSYLIRHRTDPLKLLAGLLP